MKPTAPSAKSSSGKWRWSRYLALTIVLNSGIWSASLLYLKRAKPVYTSEWALILPGSAPGVNINLPDIGQASSSGSSPFGGASTDPRANYQFMATSEVVLSRAAQSINITVKEFGEPRIKLVDNTTIMKFQHTGKTPEAAQQKSQALYQALMQQLTLFRKEELARRDEGTQATLQAAREKLILAQQHLSDYKLASGLSFQGQVDNLSVNVEQLRRQRSEFFAQQQQVAARLQQLSANLALVPRQAANAFVLQADQQFQQNLKDYSDATANLSILLSKWGDQHPAVIKEKARQAAAKISLMQRSGALLDGEVTQPELDKLQLSTTDQGGGRSSLFRDLLTAQADQKGLGSAIQALDQQIQQLDSRLNGLAQGQSRLDNLKRDVQTSEAVFASTVAKLDLGKSDIFSAYPLVQLVAEPSLPSQVTSPKKSLILLGAGLGSCLSTTGIILLGLRKRLLKVRRTPKPDPAPAIVLNLEGEALQ